MDRNHAQGLYTEAGWRRGVSRLPGWLARAPTKQLRIDCKLFAKRWRLLSPTAEICKRSGSSRERPAAAREAAESLQETPATHLLEYSPGTRTREKPGAAAGREWPGTANRQKRPTVPGPAGGSRRRPGAAGSSRRQAPPAEAGSRWEARETGSRWEQELPRPRGCQATHHRGSSDVFARVCSAMLPPRMNASANDPSTEPRRPSSVAARHLMRSVDARFYSVMVKLIL